MSVIATALEHELWSAYNLVDALLQVWDKDLNLTSEQVDQLVSKVDVILSRYTQFKRLLKHKCDDGFCGE